MPEILDMIDPKVAEKARAIAALNPDDKAKKVIKGRKGEPDIVITKASTDPVPPRPLTLDDCIPSGITGPYEGECVDCGIPVTVQPLPEGMDPDTPRAPICKEHALVRVTYAAVQEQRSIEITHRQENPVIDLNQIPDAKVGEAVKASIKTEKAKKVRKDSKAAKAKRAVQEREADQARTKTQKKRKSLIFPGFKVDQSLTVDDLDLTTGPSLNEMPSQIERRPYNQARFRILGEPSLDPETTTYQTLVDEHQRLAKAAKARRKERKAKDKDKAKTALKKPAKKAVVAHVDLTEKAKRFAAFTGVSEERALELLSR